MSLSLAAAWNELDVARYKAELYGRWHAGYRAGLSHEKLFATMGQFRRSPTVERMRLHLLRGAQQRKSLEEAIRGQRDLFIPFEAALLELGEESGGLEEILQTPGHLLSGRASYDAVGEEENGLPDDEHGRGDLHSSLSRSLPRRRDEVCSYGNR